MYIIQDRRKLQNAYLEPVWAFGNPQCAEILKLSLLSTLQELEVSDVGLIPELGNTKKKETFIQSLLLKPFEQWADPHAPKITKFVHFEVCGVTQKL